jgi:peptide/nickel transport system substrate-binding protein
MTRRTALTVLAGTVAAFTLAATGCANIGQEQAQSSEAGMIGELIFPSEVAGSITSEALANYNPLAPNKLTETWIYEPLMLRDTFSCEARPWLATAYEWRDPTTLVITVRDGVKWSDGQPFTADDVVWNVEARKKYPGADTQGIWQDTFGGKASGVRAEGNQVIITFAAPAPAKIDVILQELKILPKHVYGSVGDITKYVDKNPVGTGPFLAKDFNGRKVSLERNPDYWQADQIRVERLSLEGKYDDPNAAALKLRDGGLDIFKGDVPNPEKSVKVEGEVDYYYAPAGTTVIVPNNEQGPTSDRRFREALAYAFDKEEATLKATYGVMQPASQTMLKLPMQARELPAKYAESQGYVPHDPDKAAQLLDEAGYRKGSDGLRTDPDGKPMKLTFHVQAGWVDYIALVDTITRGWKQVGIDVRMVTTDPNAVDSQKKTGDFDFILEYINGGCQRQRDLGSKLASNQIATGKTVTPNQARYRNPAVDQVLLEMDRSTDPAQQRAGLEKLIDVYMTEFPYIAVNYAPSRLDYRLDKAAGWPSEETPYPVDQMLYVITQLKPKG